MGKDSFAEGKLDATKQTFSLSQDILHGGHKVEAWDNHRAQLESWSLSL